MPKRTRTAPASSSSLRRRAGAGCLHPVRKDGKVTAWRGLASSTDPWTDKRCRRSVSAPTRPEAERALAALIATLPGAPAAPPRQPLPVAALAPARDEGSLLAFLHRWLAFRKPELCPSTYRSYVGDLRHLVPELGEEALVALTPARIQQGVDRLFAQERTTPRNLVASVRTLRMALKQAVLWGVLQNSPAALVRPPRVKKTRTSVWTPPQVGRFLDIARPHRLFPLFQLALGTGMRKGELLALSWDDVTLEPGVAQLRVRHTWVRDEAGAWVLGDPKTASGRRTIPLAEDLAAALRLHREEEARWFGARRPEHPVFTRASGQRIDTSNLTRLFRRLTDEAELPRIRFHDLRHTAASLLIRQGIPVKLVSDRLGHADTAFTLSVYTHLYDDQRRAAALSLSRLLGAPVTELPGTSDVIAQLQALIETLRGDSARPGVDGHQPR